MLNVFKVEDTSDFLYWALEILCTRFFPEAADQRSKAQTEPWRAQAGRPFHRILMALKCGYLGYMRGWSWGIRFRAWRLGLKAVGFMLNVPEDTTDVIYAEDEEVGACDKYSEAQKVLL